MKKEELFKKLNNMLGYKRMNAKIEERYMKSLEKLNKIAIVKISNGIIDVLDI